MIEVLWSVKVNTSQPTHAAHLFPLGQPSSCYLFIASSSLTLLRPQHQYQQRFVLYPAKDAPSFGLKQMDNILSALFTSPFSLLLTRIQADHPPRLRLYMQERTTRTVAGTLADAARDFTI